MNRKQILKFAEKVYGKQDKRVKELQNAFSGSSQRISDILSRFVADDRNWKTKAPKREIQALMTEVSNMVIDESLDELSKQFVQQTFRDLPIKSNEDLAKAAIRFEITKLALQEHSVITVHLNKEAVLAEQVIEEKLNGKRPNAAGKKANQKKAYQTTKHYGRDKTIKAITKIAKEHADWSGPDYQIRNFNEKVKLMNKLDQVVDEVVKSGSNGHEFTKDFAKQMGISESRAETLLRSESVARFSQESLKEFKKNEVKKYKIESALLPTTCDDCEAQDGKVYKIDEAVVGVTMPPFHPRCFCIMTEVADYDFENNLEDD
ncbi:minor capsid protein [Pediococcus pentosaceus]|uniref:minor capsid protein n=1 Tax=Pediococcus pentosaceus TaxID=1255 RepID=UPI00265B2CAE|nr:minor capsid protein [Pediococcus pentosaceus]WKF70469.1 minor capsid protein [Pediococcus pentosaceus]